MRRLMAFCTCLVALIAFAGCGSSSGGDKTSDGSSTAGSGGGGSIQVGILAPFSGDYAYWGEGYDRGIQTWEEIHGSPKVGDRPVTIKQMDDRCDIATSLSAYRRNAPSMAAILGPACSDVVKALTPLLPTQKVPSLFFAQSASLTAGYDGGWLFRTTQPDTANLDVFGEYVNKKWKADGITKVAVVHDTSVLNKDAAAHWADSGKDQGIDVVADIGFGFDVTDFTSVVLKAKESGAQAIVIAAYGAQIAGVAKQMKQTGWDVPIATGTDAAYPSTLKAADGALEGAYFYSDFLAGSDNAGMQEFEQAFEKKFPGQIPQALEYEAYIGFSMLMQALQSPGAADGGDALSKALFAAKVQMGDFDVEFLPNGDQKQVLTFIGQVEGPKFVTRELLVDPRDSFPDYQS